LTWLHTSSYFDMDAGIYSLVIKDTDQNPAQSVLETPTFNLTGGRNYTIVLSGSLTGVGNLAFNAAVFADPDEVVD